jgi:hypothetical protein
MSRPIVVTACIVASSESGHPIGDPGTYVPVEEPSTASIDEVVLALSVRHLCSGAAFAPAASTVMP